MTEDFGSYLKSERELRGVPLEEISSVTKIPIRFLQALENNQFDDLPGDVFIQGYIRSIAKVIGSDSDAMLSAYNGIRKQYAADAKNEAMSIKNKVTTDMDFILKIGIVVLFLAGLGWGISIAIQTPSKKENKTDPVVLKSDQKKVEKIVTKKLPTLEKEITSDKVNSLNNTLENTAQSDDKLLKTASNENNASDSKVNSVKTENITEKTSKVDSLTSTSDKEMPLKLTVKIKEDTWFNINVDTSREEDFIFPKGTVKEFYGKDNFRVAIGNRQAVDLKLNDKLLSLPEGDENKVIRKFIINSKLIE